jgi:hypothetical protein
MKKGKARRRQLHAGINGLSSEQVAGIVRQEFPGARGERLNSLARAVVAKAHRQVSPRTLPRIQRG